MNRGFNGKDHEKGGRSQRGGRPEPPSHRIVGGRDRGYDRRESDRRDFREDHGRHSPPPPPPPRQPESPLSKLITAVMVIVIVIAYIYMKSKGIV